MFFREQRWQTKVLVKELLVHLESGTPQMIVDGQRIRKVHEDIVSSAGRRICRLFRIHQQLLETFPDFFPFKLRNMRAKDFLNHEIDSVLVERIEIEQRILIGCNQRPVRLQQARDFSQRIVVFLLCHVLEYTHGNKIIVMSGG